MINFLFTSFFTFVSCDLLVPMLAMIFVFGIFRLAWFLLNGGYFNE